MQKVWHQMSGTSGGGVDGGEPHLTTNGEVSIASENSEVYASTNHTLDLVIEDYGIYLHNPTQIINVDYPESCCQYVTFFRHSYE